MPRKKKRRSRAKPAEEHTHLGIRIDHYDASVKGALHHNIDDPHYALRNIDDDPLYEFLADLVVTGTCTDPKERAGDLYELTIYGEDSPQSPVHWKVKDVHAVDERYARRYREYRGKQVPIYAPPKGMGSLDKVRGESRWHGALFVHPHFVTDALILLGHGRQLYLSLHELKAERQRRIQSVRVQTADPAEE